MYSIVCMQHDFFTLKWQSHAGGTDMVKGINCDEVNYINTWYTTVPESPADLDFLIKSKVLMEENGLNFPRTADDAISFYVDMCSFLEYRNDN